MDQRLVLFLESFRKNAHWVEERTQKGIEESRKGNFSVSFTDENGTAVSGVNVQLKQKTHDFRFGCNLFMLDELETDEKNETYKKLYPEMFNIATLPFYWNDLEPEQGKPRFAKDSPKVYRRPAPDLCVEYCQEHGIEPKLHCLCYDQWSPRWLPRDVPTIKNLLEKRIREIAERYHNVIPTMEVTNETYCNEYDEPTRRSTPFFREEDYVEWSFETARKYLPNTNLIINEGTNQTWSTYKYKRTPYYMQIREALRNGASIDSIGLQYHLFHKDEATTKRKKKVYDPEIIFGLLDTMADFHKPLQITEVTIPAFSANAEDEAAQAEVMTWLYKIWFSHPNMEAIIYWNMVDGYAAFAEQGDMTCGENVFHGGLLRFDMSKKPVWYAMHDLIHKTWHTELTDNTGADNVLSGRGFYGEYEVEATVNGKTVTTCIHVKKGEENKFTITI